MKRISALCAAAFLSLVGQVVGIPENVTVDLNNPSVVQYIPSGTWSTKSVTSQCENVQTGGLDHFTTTTSSSLSLQFQGTAIWVWGVRTNQTGVITYTIDGGKPINDNPGAVPSGSLSCALLFPSGNLTNALHNLTVTLASAAPSGNGSTIATLDVTLIQFTQDTDATSSASGSPTQAPAAVANHKVAVGAIAGGVVGGVGAFSLIVLAIFIFIRRRRQSTPDADFKVTPIRDVDLGDLPRASMKPGSPEMRIRPLLVSEDETADGHGRRPSTPMSGTTPLDSPDSGSYRQTYTRGPSSATSSKFRSLSPVSDTASHSVTSLDRSTIAPPAIDYGYLAQTVAAVMRANPSANHLPEPSEQGDFRTESGHTAPPPEYQEHSDR